MSSYEQPVAEAVELAQIKATRDREHEAHERRLRRIEYGAWVIGFLGFFVAACVLGWIWWQAARGPSAEQELEHSEKLACVQAGGTWLKVGSGDASGFGTCTRSER